MAFIKIKQNPRIYETILLDRIIRQQIYNYELLGILHIYKEEEGCSEVSLENTQSMLLDFSSALFLTKSIEKKSKRKARSDM